MKVKLNRDLLVGQVDHQPGDVVEVDDARGRDIVAKGDGEIVGDYPGPPIAPYNAVSTGAPRVVPPPELTGEVLPVAPAPGEVVTKVGARETKRVAVAAPNEATVEVTVESPDGDTRPPDAVVPNARPGDEVVVTDPGRPATYVAKAPEPKDEPAKPKGPKNDPK